MCTYRVIGINYCPLRQQLVVCLLDNFQLMAISFADVTTNEDSDSSGDIEDMTDQAVGELSGMLSC